MERADLTEALGNVLDNAVRYAKTTVRVSCQGDSEPLAIVIEDDGPGIEQTLEVIIRQRGGRLDACPSCRTFWTLIAGGWTSDPPRWEV